MYYNLSKISLSRGGSYIHFPEWLKNKKAAINPKKNDDKCFQYSVAVTLNHEQIKSHPGRIPHITPLLTNIIGKRFSIKWKRLEKVELNDKSIVLNILYVPYNN